jgi:hypothetical protein
MKLILLILLIPLGFLFSEPKKVQIINGTYVGYCQGGEKIVSYTFKDNTFKYSAEHTLLCLVSEGSGQYDIIDSLLLLRYKDAKNKDEISINYTASDTTEGLQVFEFQLKINNLKDTNNHAEIRLEQFQISYANLNGKPKIMTIENDYNWKIQTITVSLDRNCSPFYLTVQDTTKNHHKFIVSLDLPRRIYFENYVDTLIIQDIQKDYLLLKDSPTKEEEQSLKELNELMVPLGEPKVDYYMPCRFYSKQ